jgi:N-acetylglucosaminyldiphosphoundecaprenol N-acetyl-beta-D-mannosaminyltransferase
MRWPSRHAQIRVRIRPGDREFDQVTVQDALDRIASAIGSRSYCRRVAINAAKLVAMYHDDRLREMVNSRELVPADGQAVMWASRPPRDPVPERVTIDLVEAPFARAEQRGWRVCIVRVGHDVLGAAQRIRARRPGLRIVAWPDGYVEAAGDGAMGESIRRTGFRVLCVAIDLGPRKLLGVRGPLLVDRSPHEGSRE